MHYIALATDYDGTLAQDGHVDEPTVAALQRLRASGRRVILVTGRQLPELQSVCSVLEVFDAVIAENGALLYWPGERREEVLGKPVPPALIAELDRLGVKPYAVGKSIFATWRPHEGVVQESIQRLGIDSHIIFNKRAVMVLPNNISKATGLVTALDRFRIPSSQVVGVGDAENDFPFLRACGISVAVGNAIPALKEDCDIVVQGDHGRGVAELIAALIDDDLQSLIRHSVDGRSISTSG